MHITIERYPSRGENCGTVGCENTDPLFEVTISNGGRQHAGYAFVACVKHLRAFRADLTCEADGVLRGVNV